MPPMNRYIDMYCERTQYGFFEEPLNVLSNLGFLIGAFYLCKFIRTKEKQPFSSYFMIIICGVIGIGSMVFHATARMWAAVYFDVMPIAIFAAVLMFLLARHVLRLGIIGTTLMLALLIFENYIFKSFVNHAPDGYVSLIPCAFFLIFISVYMAFTKNISAHSISLATVIAVVAITLRALDTRICDIFPYGTHFLWHGFMSVFMYIVIRELIIRHRHYDPLTNPSS